MKTVRGSALLLATLSIPLCGTANAVEEVVTRVYVTERLLPKFFNENPFGNLPPYAAYLDLFEDRPRRHPVKAAPASQANSSKDCAKTPISPNPVIIATGEKIKTEPDFSSSGRYGLGLERTYRSKNNTGVLFGPNWLSTLDPARLTPSATCTRRIANWPCVPDSFTLTEPDGTKYTYTYKSHVAQIVEAEHSDQDDDDDDAAASYGAAGEGTGLDEGNADNPTRVIRGKRRATRSAQAATYPRISCTP